MKRVKDIFGNYSIGKKFTISLIVSLIIPLVILLLGINYNLIHNMNEHNSKTNLEILKQTKTPIDYMIQDLSYVSLQVIGDSTVQKLLDDGENLTTEEKQILIEASRFTIAQLIEGKDYITRLTVQDDNTRYIQMGAYLNEGERNYFQEAASGKGRLIWLPTVKESNYVSSYDRIYEVSMVRSINSLRTFQESKGYIRINIDHKYLSSLYRGIATESTREFFIMSETGDVISSFDESLIGTNISERKYFDQVINRSEGYFDTRNEVISFYKIPSNNWYVVKIDDSGSVLQGFILNSVIFLCMFLVIVFGIVFYYIQKKQIIDPLVLLATDVGQFKEGEYLIHEYATSDDEIGDLNRNFIAMSHYIEELIESVYKSQIKEKEAQLSYLQSQINPHFLYNTLDSIRWMAIKEKQYDMASQIEALAHLFKHALNQGKEMTTVEEEVSHLKSYLLIQKNKFGDRLQTEIFVGEGCGERKVLNLILQPLVENSILHGFENKIGVGNIKITISMEDDILIYKVQDDGLGADEQKIREILASEKESHNALALTNINQRLKYKYGEEYGLSFSSEIGSGTIVTVRLPM